MCVLVYARTYTQTTRLAEEQYAHVAEEQHKQLGLVFEQRRGIDVHGLAESHTGQGRVCRPVACSGV